MIAILIIAILVSALLFRPSPVEERRWMEATALVRQSWIPHP